MYDDIAYVRRADGAEPGLYEIFILDDNLAREFDAFEPQRETDRSQIRNAYATWNSETRGIEFSPRYEGRSDPGRVEQAIFDHFHEMALFYAMRDNDLAVVQKYDDGYDGGAYKVVVPNGTKFHFYFRPGVQSSILVAKAAAEAAADAFNAGFDGSIPEWQEMLNRVEAYEREVYGKAV